MHTGWLAQLGAAIATCAGSARHRNVTSGSEIQTPDTRTLRGVEAPCQVGAGTLNSFSGRGLSAGTFLPPFKLVAAAAMCAGGRTTP